MLNLWGGLHEVVTVLVRVSTCFVMLANGVPVGVGLDGTGICDGDCAAAGISGSFAGCSGRSNCEAKCIEPEAANPSSLSSSSSSTNPAVILWRLGSVCRGVSSRSSFFLFCASVGEPARSGESMKGIFARGGEDGNDRGNRLDFLSVLWDFVGVSIHLSDQLVPIPLVLMHIYQVLYPRHSEKHQKDSTHDAG